MQAALPKCAVKKDGDVKFPGIQTLYDFYAPRTKSINVYSYGFRAGGVETFLAECTGATIQVFDSRPGAKEKFEIFDRIMTDHEAKDSDPEWAKELTEYWILPDSVTFSNTLPALYTGTLDLSGVSTPLTQFTAESIDLVKVDYGEHTSFLVQMILGKGYRPGLLLVNWEAHPDESALTMSAAGHVQTLGYRLLGSAGNYFAYMFMDQCMYEVCSWARKDCMNPMFEEYRKQMFESFMNPENLKKE